MEKEDFLSIETLRRLDKHIQSDSKILDLESVNNAISKVLEDIEEHTEEAIKQITLSLSDPNKVLKQLKINRYSRHAARVLHTKINVLDTINNENNEDPAELNPEMLEDTINTTQLEIGGGKISQDNILRQLTILFLESEERPDICRKYTLPQFEKTLKKKTSELKEAMKLSGDDREDALLTIGLNILEEIFPKYFSEYNIDFLNPLVTELYTETDTTKIPYMKDDPTEVH